MLVQLCFTVLTGSFSLHVMLIQVQQDGILRKIAVQQQKLYIGTF